jgi:hypothetical protein
MRWPTPRATALKNAAWMLVVPTSSWPEASSGVICAPLANGSSCKSIPSSRK